MSNRHLPKTTLEQWRLLDAVIEFGSFAEAAQQLARSQSAISYGIARLQEQIGVPLLEVQGRRAVLTDAGRTLLQQARPLISDLLRVEERASAIGQGWESELRLALDAIFPPNALFAALSEFRNTCPHTSLVLSEEILSGADEALINGEVQLAVCSKIPVGFMGDRLLDVELIAVAHGQHPLHQIPRSLTLDDLAKHTHIVIRDSGRTQPRSDGWTGARLRWTVSSLSTSLEAIRNQIGYAWLPRHIVAGDLETGRLKALPLLAGSTRSVPLYIIHSNQEMVGPAALVLDGCLRQMSRE